MKSAGAVDLPYKEFHRAYSLNQFARGFLCFLRQARQQQHHLHHHISSSTTSAAAAHQHDTCTGAAHALLPLYHRVNDRQLEHEAPLRRRHSRPIITITIIIIIIIIIITIIITITITIIIIITITIIIITPPLQRFAPSWAAPTSSPAFLKSSRTLRV